uniref:Uncharacterized protein n=1 Tax=Micrurus carvalhoi TaxID=3147026 RepID=A0A2H6NBH6_9SAUR
MTPNFIESLFILYISIPTHPHKFLRLYSSTASALCYAKIVLSHKATQRGMEKGIAFIKVHFINNVARPVTVKYIISNGLSIYCLHITALGELKDSQSWRKFSRITKLYRT